MSSGITDNSLKYHLENAKKNGVTQEEMAGIITHTAFYAGWPKAWAVFNLKKEYTILIIAHRFSTIVNCDKIYYISNGKVIDSGTHSELLKTCNEYKHLYESEIKYNK